MARVIRLTDRFRRRLEALRVAPGSPTSAAIGATIGALAEAEVLPGMLDTAASLPPTGRALVRRVGGRNLWIWYRLEGGELKLVTLTRSPPVPLDKT